MALDKNRFKEHTHIYSCMTSFIDPRTYSKKKLSQTTWTLVVEGLERYIETGVRELVIRRSGNN